MKLYITTMIFNPYDDREKGKLRFSPNKETKRDNFEFNESTKEYTSIYDGWFCDRYYKEIEKTTNRLGIYVSEIATEEPVTNERDQLGLLKSKMFRSIAEFIHNEKDEFIKMCDAKLSMLDNLEIEEE